MKYKGALISCIINSRIDYSCVCSELNEMSESEVLEFYARVQSDINELKRYIIEYAMYHNSDDVISYINIIIDRIKKQFDNQPTGKALYYLTISYFSFKNVLDNYKNLIGIIGN